MKRVTILVDDIGETDEDGERLLMGLRLGYGSDCWVAADRILSVEDYIEPLPTEPGTRFWGRLGNAEPQWWFIRTVCSSLYYVPTRDERAVRIDEVQYAGLVRLPDPKPAETDGAR